MIPLRLKLKNFLSYGDTEQDINFVPHHLICLSGKNGHGKSALLDAITWSIWGQARKVSGQIKADANLLRLGQTHMMVTLDFYANGNTYRVIREYGENKKRNSTKLNFGILNEDKLHALTEKTIRETQEKIISCIGLDYESFINSVFLRQGQSNEFSKKSARERKEILANILGLNHYEDLRKKAQEKVRLLNQEKELITKQIELTQQEITENQNINDNLNQLEIDITKIKRQEKELLDNKLKLKEIANKLDQKNLEFTKISLLYNQIQEQIKIKTKKLTEENKNLEDLLKKNAQFREEIEKNKLEQQKFEQIIKNFQSQENTYKNSEIKIKKHQSELEKLSKELIDNYNKKSHELTHKLSGYKTSIEHLEKNIKELEEERKEQELELKKLENAKEKFLKHLETNKDLNKNIKDNETAIERRKEFYQRFISKGNQLKQELADTLEKLKLLENDTPNCPLCEQYLKENLKEKLQNKLQKQESLIKHQITRLRNILQELKNSLIKQHKLLEELKKQAQENTKFEVELKNLNQKISLHLETQKIVEKNLLNLHNNLKSTKEDFDKYNTLIKDFTQEKFLQENKEYTKVKDLLESENKIFDELKKQEKEYQETIKALNLLHQKSLEQQKISTEISIQENKKHELQELSKEIEELKVKEKEFEVKVKDHEIHKQALNNLNNQENLLEKSLEELRTEKEDIMLQKGRLEHQQVLLKQKKESIKTQEEKIKSISNTTFEYQTISQALSKDGIQALLIEEAIPEIEDEANELLAKLTENQTHLIIESLRDLKSGSTKETLDIKISDVLGIRPYEMFSGGEAFRIDFAIRVAISKLLAKRAGTSLQLLIIDEGFGSQDEEGLSQIMNVIYKIQDDFSKIIVVSHLADMKDQFPSQFMVQKTAQGSQIDIINQG